MKKKLTLLCFTLLSISVLSQEKFVAPTPKYKELLFKTPEYWTKLNLTKKGLPIPKRGKGMLNITDPKTQLQPAPRNVPPAFNYQNCQEELASPSASRMDMRDYDIITPVKDQGGCGDCWAFGTVAALETSECLVNGINPATIQLSEEQVLSCTGSSTFSGNNCNGGVPSCAAGYLMNHDALPYGTWPYMDYQQSYLCENFQNDHSSYIAEGWGWICDPFSLCFTPSEAQIKQAICTYGSVVTALNTNGFDSYWYVTNPNQIISGVPSGGPVPSSDHIVQIIGWNDDLGAWLIKNSWGTDWGIGGFGWVKYGQNDIGAWSIWIQAKNFQNACPYSSSDCLAHALVMQFNTGGDNLGGGSTNCNVTLNFINGTSQQFVNVNNGGAWNNNSTNTVTVRIANPVPLTSLKSMTVYTKACSGISCDNWNLNGLTITAEGGFANDIIYSAQGSPLFRFTGSNYSQTYYFTNLGPCGAPPPPANPTTDQLQVNFLTGGDDLRGGDPLNITIYYSDNTNQVFSNVNANANWQNNSSNTVTLNLNRSVNPSNITQMQMAIQHCGGMGCDNWNLQQLKVTAVENNQSQVVLYSNSGNPFHRFTGGGNTYTVTLQ